MTTQPSDAAQAAAFREWVAESGTVGGPMLRFIDTRARELDAQQPTQPVMECVGWEWLDTRDSLGWMRMNMSPESTPPLSPEIKYRRVYAGPVEGGE